MPVIEPVVLDLQAYRLRLVGPKAVVYPNTIGQEFTILNCNTMVARPLPQANLPFTPDFASGQWTGRVGDAGDGKFIWPNRESSDGIPWRLRFDPTNKLQWLEVYVNEYLESVLCITKVVPAYNQIEVNGYDGFQMCKSAYVRDWVCTQAPRDVIEHGTMLWLPLVVDDFSSGMITSNSVVTPNYTWLLTTSAGTLYGFTTGAAILANGGLEFGLTSWDGEYVTITSYNFPPTLQSGWFAQVRLSFLNLADNIFTLSLEVECTLGVLYTIQLVIFNNDARANLLIGEDQVFTLNITGVIDYNLTLECDGEWVMGFVNGQLLGMIRLAENAYPQSCEFGMVGNILVRDSTSLATDLPREGENELYSTVVLNSIIFRGLVPFLMAGTDKGDYVLPGTVSTYTQGGIHGRYFNDLDLASDPNRLLKIMSPVRTQAYSGTGIPGEYQNQQDLSIDGQPCATATSGAGPPGSNWSSRWFGSVYLKLSNGGNYTFSIITSLTSDTALRLWVGKTQWSDQIIDEWAWSTSGSYTKVLLASTLAGTLSYGQGTVLRDGWYPIVLEYAVDSGIAGAPSLLFTWNPSGGGGSYVDPGGTTIVASEPIVIPPSSLSPLGCIDNRYQGTSHYNLVQQTAQAVGYQFSVEPKQLEALDPVNGANLFPGVLAPRIQEGTNYDVILEPDDTPRREGLINYSATVDGTDQASSIQGNGAGFQNGLTGQLQALIYDSFTLNNSLFDMQAWQDSSDASFSSLLESLLNSQLGLRLTPWVIVSGDPIARSRIAETWPLARVYGQMRWRPGDSVFVRALDINVYDTTPRQLLLVTRQVLPNGISSTQVGFAARPKSSVYANRQLLQTTTRLQRNYQRQKVTITGTYLDGAAIGPFPANTGWSFVSLSPGDTVIRAQLRINYIILVTGTIGPPSVGVMTTAGDVTSMLNGPWSLAPLILDVTSVAVPDQFSRLCFGITNMASNSVTVSYQLQVDLLR